MNDFWYYVIIHTVTVLLVFSIYKNYKQSNNSDADVDTFYKFYFWPIVLIVVILYYILNYIFSIFHKGVGYLVNKVLKHVK